MTKLQYQIKMKERARAELRAKGVKNVDKLSKRYLTLTTGYNDHVPLFYRPRDRPFWPMLIKYYGSAKSRPSRVQPVDKSLLSAFVDPMVKTLSDIHKF